MSARYFRAEPLDHLGDFTTTPRVLPIAALALVIGVFAAFVAAALLTLIGLFPKPRSVIPVALASVAAAAVRRHVLGPGPIFPVAPHPDFVGAGGLARCVVVGLLAGALSALLTAAVYASEDAFQRVPIHGMWWPALGGLAIGSGGFFFPQALGVGCDVLGGLLQGDMPLRIIAGCSSSSRRSGRFHSDPGPPAACWRRC